MATVLDATLPIDFSRVTVTQPKSNAKGGSVVNVQYDGKPFLISFPLMSVWGATEGVDQQKNLTGNYSMGLQFPSAERPNAEASAMLENLKALEKHFHALGFKNTMDWFGRPLTSVDSAAAKFREMLRYPKLTKTGKALDYTKAPSLNIKLPCHKGVWQTSVFNEDSEPLYVKGKTQNATPLDFLTSESKAPFSATGVIKVTIWLQESVSITWELVQAAVRPPSMPSIAPDVCLMKISDSARAVMRSETREECAPVIPSYVPTSAEVSHMAAVVEDSEEDEDETEQELPPPAPVVAVAAPIPAPVVVAPAPVAAAAAEPEPAKVKKTITRKKAT